MCVCVCSNLPTSTSITAFQPIFYWAQEIEIGTNLGVPHANKLWDNEDENKKLIFLCAMLMSWIYRCKFNFRLFHSIFFIPLFFFFFDVRIMFDKLHVDKQFVVSSGNMCSSSIYHIFLIFISSSGFSLYICDWWIGSLVQWITLEEKTILNKNKIDYTEAEQLLMASDHHPDRKTHKINSVDTYLIGLHWCDKRLCFDSFQCVFASFFLMTKLE